MSERAESDVDAMAPVTGRNARVVAVLFLGAAVASTIALFPPYHQGQPGLVSSLDVVLYNLPSLVGWVVAGLLLLTRRVAGAGIGVALTAGWAPTIIGDIGSMVGAGYSPGAGSLLTYAGLALAIAACVCALRFGCFGGRAGRPPIWLTAAAAIAGLVFAVGLLIPEYRVIGKLSTPGMTFPVSGTDTASWECCPVGGEPPYIQTMMVIIALLAIAVPMVAMPLRRAIRLGALAGVLLGWIAMSMTSAARLLMPLGPADVGYSDEDATYAGLAIIQEALPGLWMLAGGMVLLTAVIGVDAARPRFAISHSQRATARGEPSVTPPDAAGPAR